MIEYEEFNKRWDIKIAGELVVIFFVIRHCVLVLLFFPYFELLAANDNFRGHCHDECNLQKLICMCCSPRIPAPHRSPSRTTEGQQSFVSWVACGSHSYCFCSVSFEIRKWHVYPRDSVVPTRKRPNGVWLYESGRFVCLL